MYLLKKKVLLLQVENLWLTNKQYNCLLYLNKILDFTQSNRDMLERPELNWQQISSRHR